MCLRLPVTSLVVLLLVSNAASAQTAAADIQARVKERQKIVVTDDQGRQFQGRVVQMTDRFITVEQRRDRVDVAYAEITAIDRPKDGVGNGALVGLAVGAAIGSAFALSDGPDQSASPFCGMGFLDNCGDSNVLAPVIAWQFLSPYPVYVAVVVVMTAFLIIRHQSNIEKLLAGTESRFGKK